MRRVGVGEPEPLGVTLSDDGVNVAVFSAHAEAIEFCLFGEDGNTELERVRLHGCTGNVFHAAIAGVRAGTRYGLRANGRWAPREGHRFNAAKLLVDPYARAIDRPFVLHPSMSGGAGDGAHGDLDSAAFVPKGIVATAQPARAVVRPRVPWGETTIYELHVRGFTRLHPAVPESLRGTCAGLAHPAALAHLVRLGVTAVELLPIAAAVDEPHLMRAGLRNYWGYNTIGWSIPDPRLAPGGIAELRACVDALHDAGIEVLLDVVFNHSGEGDANGPTLSLRGLDNATYYRTTPDAEHEYVNDTGCGNTLALDRAPVQQLVLDALRWYANVAGVDGFRFDLATTLGRDERGFDAKATLLTAITTDPALRDLKFIAEPWDVGPGGYQAGAFPASWGEWNDRYRDSVRRFWRGDPGLTGEMATRFAGSADLFTAPARLPSRSVNYVAAHDGFTLADVVSYAQKHNEANGESNRDGSSANHSWNHGVEGSTSDPQVLAARRRDARALLATLFFSRGTPMLGMGDECGRSQQGNNNAYAQDNALSWLDWEQADDALVAFTAALIRIRRTHPALRADRRLVGRATDASGIADVQWRRLDDTPMTDADWTSEATRTLVAVLYAESQRLVVALHAGDRESTLRLPQSRAGCAWQLLVDTARAEPALEPALVIRAPDLLLAPRSVVLLTEVRSSPT
jgi:glycogen operon protein